MATPKLRLITTSKELNTTKYRASSTGIHLPSGRYVAPGAKVMTQAAAYSLHTARRPSHYQTAKPSLSIQKHLRLTSSQLQVKASRAA